MAGPAAAAAPTAGTSTPAATNPSNQTSDPASSQSVSHTKHKTGVTTSATKQQPSDPVPLAASLQSTFNLLIRRLGQLLAYQVQLRAKNAAVSPAQMQLMPGWTDLVAAAQRWQSDIVALHRWLLRAQDGLAIELTRARKREAIQAQEAAKRAAEEERERAAKAREAEADASKRPSEAATAAPADGNNGATRNSAGDPVIDLTAEEEDDDDAKPLKSRPSGAKRQREEDDPGGENQPGDALKDGSAASGDGESAKRQKTQGESIPGSATDGQQAISQPDPAALLAALTGAAAGGPNQAQAEPTASGAPANNGNFDLNSMDLSNLDGLPDLSNVDFSAFMNTDAGNMPGGAPAPGAGDAQGQGASNLTGPPADTANTGGDAPAAADTTGAATATQDAQTAQEGGGSAPAAEPGTSAGIAGAQTGSEQNPASGAGADASNPADPGGMGNFAMGDDLSGMNINMSDFGNMNFGDMGMGMGMFGGGDGEGGAGTGEGSGMENIDFGAALQGVDWSNLYNTLAGSGGLEGLGGMEEGGGESGGS